MRQTLLSLELPGFKEDSGTFVMFDSLGVYILMLHLDLFSSMQMSFLSSRINVKK